MQTQSRKTGNAVRRAENPEKGALNCTHRRLLDDVQDGDGELRVREGVRLGVDFGHGVCRDCGGVKETGSGSIDEGDVLSIGGDSIPRRRMVFSRGTLCSRGASKDAR